VHLVRAADGAIGFEILCGGGLGRMPIIGKRIREWLPQGELLAYLEAILRVYNRHGRRDGNHSGQRGRTDSAGGSQRQPGHDACAMELERTRRWRFFGAVDAFFGIRKFAVLAKIFIGELDPWNESS